MDSTESRTVYIQFIMAISLIVTVFCSSALLAQEPPLIVCTEIDSPPFSFIDSEGHPAGYNVDLVKAIAEVMNLTTVATQPEALRLLAQGRHYCALVGRLQGNYWISRHNLSTLKVEGPLLSLSQYCLAVTEGNFPLQSVFAGALNTLSHNGQEQEIYNKWLGVLAHENRFSTKVLKYLSYFAVLVFLLVAFLVIRSARYKKQLVAHTRDLHQRTKELQCIFSVAEATIKHHSIEELLKTVVKIIPSGWQFPEITQASIQFDNQQFSSENFTKSPWVQSSGLVLDGQTRGRVDVYYMKEQAQSDEGPFLWTERQLITTVSQLLSEAIRAQLSESLLPENKASYKNLFHQMLNGFSVHEIICDDTGRPVDYRFIDVNPAFGRLTGLTAEMVVGKTVRQVIPNIEQSWIDRFGKVALTEEPDFFESYVQEFNKHFEVTAFSPAPNQFACFFADVTLKKDYEASQAKYRERLQSLAYKLAHAEELLRQDIAAGLHDSIGQDLAALKLNVDIVRLNKNPKKNALSEEKSENVLNQISDSIDEVVHKVWNLSFQLCPPGLFKAGFVPTLEWLIEQFKSKHEINFRLIVESDQSEMDKQIKSLLFQMIRELIVNAIKHANPTEIKIVLEMQNENLHASVIDNGSGFDALSTMTTTDSSSGFGLFGIKERLAFLSGKLEIDSSPNQGTKISIILPLTNNINLPGKHKNEIN